MLCGTGNTTDCIELRSPAGGGSIALQYTLRGLTPGAIYSIRIVPINEAGLGTPGYAVPVCQRDLDSCEPQLVARSLPVVPSDIVLSAPQSANLFSKDELTLSFRAGPSGGVNNTQYRVEFDTSPTFDSRSGRPMSAGWNGTVDELSSPIVPEGTPAGDELYYTINGIDQGVEIYVRVQAANSLGFGPASETLSAKPFVLPQEPSFVALGQVSEQEASSMQHRGTTLRIDINPPGDSGGDEIENFRVEWGTEPLDRCTDTNSSYQYRCDVQVIRPAASVITNQADLTGWMQITLDTSTCGACYDRSARRSPRIPPTATAQDIELAIESMPNSGDVTVERTTLSAPSASFNGLYEWKVTFLTLVGDGGNISSVSLPGGVPLLGLETADVLADGVPVSGAIVNDVNSLDRVVGVRPRGYCSSG